MGDPPSVAEHLPSDVLADGRGPVQLEQHVGLQKVLSSVHLEVGDGCTDAHPFVLDVVDHVLLVHGVGDKVDAPESGVFIAGVEGLEAVTESFLSAVVGQPGGVVSSASHGPVPVTNQSVGHHQRDVVRVGPPAALHGDGDMGQRHRVVPHPNVAPGVPAVLVDGDLSRAVGPDLRDAFILKSEDIIF